MQLKKITMEKKLAIYIRTSTTEQTPELQLRDIYANFPEAREAYVFQEQVSAYKDNVKRPVFDCIMEMIDTGSITDLYVWDWDRIYRNYKKLNHFFVLCKKNEKHNTIKVHSYGQKMFEQFVNLPEPFDTMLTDMMQTLTGFMGESESKKKSERIKMAVDKSEKKTKSYKGNEWGRKADITEADVQKMLELRNQGLSYKDIGKQITRFDKQKNMLVCLPAKTIYTKIKEK